MKSILIYTYDFPPLAGGAGSVAYDIATRLQRQGHVVRLVTSRVRERKNTELDIVEVTSIPRFRQWFFYRILPYDEILAFDSIILNGTLAVSMAALFFPEELIKRSTVYLHGLEVEYMSANWIQRKLVGFDKKYVNLLVRCRSILAVSTFIKRRVLEHLNLQDIEQKVVLVGNAVDHSVFYRNEIDLHERLQIPRQRKILLSVSRVIAGKGFELVLRELEVALQSDPDYHWVVVGEGPFLASLRKLVSSFKVEDHVTLVGRVDRTYLKDFYSSADLFVLLSQFQESFGLVYLEANACGLATVGMNSGGVGDVIRDGVNGYLIDTPQELRSILATRRWESLNRERIMRSAFEHSWDESLVRLLESI